jgi:hypothetical protein
MTVPTITVLPTAPARTDAPATFNTRADAFLGALYNPFSDQMNASIGAFNTDFTTVATNVTAAQTAQTGAETAETAAEAAQAAAESAANATIWVTAVAVTLGDVRFSPINFRSYRVNKNLTTVTNVTDPSTATADWVLVSSGDSESLAATLSAGNTTSGTDLAVSTGDDITFADNSKAIFGAGSDLQIYHDGSNSYVSEQGTGPLKFLSNGLQVKNAADDESMIVANQNGAVTLYHDNAAKLATTSTGIDVTGTATVTTAGTAGILNRLSTDGDILDIRKDGTTIGKVGVDNGDNLFIEGDSTHSGLQFGTSAVLPHKNGITANGVVDIGQAASRFKDLYLSGDITTTGFISGNLKDYGEITNAIGSTGGGTQDIDMTLGNSVTATVDTSANTFTFSNPTASDELCGFTLLLTNGGSQTVNWPASVDWPAGLAPTLTAAGVDKLVFETTDGGTNWQGNAAGLAYA